jgi:hypothetical protein
VGGGGEAQGRENEVDQDQERPDASEEHELGFGGGPGVVAGSGPVVDDYGEGLVRGVLEWMCTEAAWRSVEQREYNGGMKGVTRRISEIV